MLTGTEPPKTTDVVRILKSIVIKDLPIHLRHTQGCGTLGPWTLDTLDQFGFELEDLLIEQQQIGLPDFQPFDDPFRQRGPQFVKGERPPPASLLAAVALDSTSGCDPWAPTALRMRTS